MLGFFSSFGEIFVRVLAINCYNFNLFHHELTNGEIFKNILIAKVKLKIFLDDKIFSSNSKDIVPKF